MHPYTSFVALGDSFTEGLDDPGPDGMYRGWADLVATRLAAEAPGFPYANLAVRGRLLAAVVDEQVPPALEMGADLVSFAAGANDAMRRHFDAGAIAAGLDDVVARIRATVSQPVGCYAGVWSRSTTSSGPRQLSTARWSSRAWASAGWPILGCGASTASTSAPTATGWWQRRSWTPSG